MHEGSQCNSRTFSEIFVRSKFDCKRTVVVFIVFRNYTVTRLRKIVVRIDPILQLTPHAIVALIRGDGAGDVQKK